MLSSASRVYPLIGIFSGYVLVMCFNPVRVALRDGLRCLARFKRVWLTFALLGFAYSVFQFAVFTPLQHASDLEFSQLSMASWNWPRVVEVWGEIPLPALEGVAGIFDNATTTYPLSVVAAILMVINWRGLHGAFLRALRKRYRLWSYPIYLVILLSVFASLLKPVIFWRLPEWGGMASAGRLLQISAAVDAIAFIFEYLLGVYIQVYLITVCLAWVKGLSFGEEPLFRFAMRRFSYVLEWAGIVLVVGTLIVRVPLLLAYFRDLPNVLDYLPLERVLMSGLIILFCSVQISLVLHNETLGAAVRAHRQFIQRNAGRFAWFLLICALHYLVLAGTDAVMRGAIADRAGAAILWKIMYVLLRGFITGWLLASWVCLFRQCETARIGQESWIPY